jgi:hypothetical protein
MSLLGCLVITEGYSVAYLAPLNYRKKVTLSVTTTNKQTIIWDEVINGVQIRAEFDLGAYSPQELIQSVNELLVDA